jgi:hypothetical protein
MRELLNSSVDGNRFLRRFNIMDDAREIDYFAFHAGCPVLEGEKWSE